MRSSSRISGSSRCSTSVYGSGRGAARRSRCRACSRPWPCSPTWRRSSKRESTIVATRSARIVRPPAAALAFLTLLPLGRLELDERDVARGALFFPVVGALVGAALAFVGIGFEDTLTPFLAAGVAVAFEALVTGGIHLDALADASDGLGARTRARALEIMGEGPVGAFGATSLILGLLLKTGAIAVLLAA